MILRSFLFLPGNSPGMLVNGLALAADALILDLEDAVAPEQKDAARDLVASAMKHLDYGSKRLVIRINALDTNFWEADLAALIPLQPFAIMPPKITSKAMVQEVDRAISLLEQEHGLDPASIRLIPLIESAKGVLEAPEIAKASSRVLGLFLGAEDLTADLGAERTKEGEEIAFARAAIVLAAKAAGVLAIDTPFTDARDLAGLLKDARKARGLGFDAKASISPHHLQGIHEVFSPTEDEVQYAFEVLAAIEEGEKLGMGAVSLRGKMIDKPIFLRAKKTLADAKSLGRLDAEALALLEKQQEVG